MSPRRTENELAKPLAATMILLLLITGCVSTKPLPTSMSAEAGYVPAFEPADCQFYMPSGYDIECGYLVVPEDRSQPDGRTIRLHVAVFKTPNPNPSPDPVVHLIGGPGGSLLDGIAYFAAGALDGSLETRDYIVFNQRGTRYATPFLDCPGYRELMRELAEQGLGREQRDERETEFLLSCHDDLLAQGFNLAAYNSAENAADVNDLRVVLGYDQVNLYGTSYGSRLALTIMRDYPVGVRSAIIDSVYPPQVNIDHTMPANAARAFQAIFEDCAADPHCSQTYPDLETTFYTIIDQLNANPAQIVVDGSTVTVEGTHVMDFVFGALYFKDAIPSIPWLITAISQGDLQVVAPVFESSFTDNLSQAMYHSLQCREEVAFESYEEAKALSRDLPRQIQENYVSTFPFDLCTSWESGVADPVENEAVVSDIPTLVVVGRYDPITPPAWGWLAAETLDNSFVYEFPGVGHGVIRSNTCALEIALQFLDNPTTEPDAACITGLSGPGFFK